MTPDIVLAVTIVVLALADFLGDRFLGRRIDRVQEEMWFVTDNLQRQIRKLRGEPPEDAP